MAFLCRCIGKHCLFPNSLNHFTTLSFTHSLNQTLTHLTTHGVLWHIITIITNAMHVNNEDSIAFTLAEHIQEITAKVHLQNDHPCSGPVMAWRCSHPQNQATTYWMPASSNTTDTPTYFTIGSDVFFQSSPRESFILEYDSGSFDT